eukprot:CAMPEP_0206578992 /NCGR_PEP_ID=MMETSP0325_2-20121206/32288_1 /ASSEMBLY_ACC=CAM_ASM_000347 /TAXON_ID=2866 /ORGANISM="Crypthecodinium cohnii, Strain Seligo" /LENGTH=271 /DNA_ID=CAMNT_0054084727 /DNA_START=264 /DNA_END=1081 /DNA_ORIENTATION=-
MILTVEPRLGVEETPPTVVRAFVTVTRTAAESLAVLLWIAMTSEMHINCILQESVPGDSMMMTARDCSTAVAASSSVIHSRSMGRYPLDFAHDMFLRLNEENTHSSSSFIIPRIGAYNDIVGDRPGWTGGSVAVFVVDAYSPPADLNDGLPQQAKMLASGADWALEGYVRGCFREQPSVTNGNHGQGNTVLVQITSRGVQVQRQLVQILTWGDLETGSSDPYDVDLVCSESANYLPCTPCSSEGVLCKVDDEGTDSALDDVEKYTQVNQVV